MSDYLTNLLTRTQYPERTIQPRLPSLFDAASPVAASGEAEWGAVSEQPYPAVQGNQRVPRHDLSARQSPEGMGQGQEDPIPIRERATQQGERGLESTTVLERRESSSETTSVPDLKDVALEATPVLGQVRMKPRDDGGIPSRHPVVLSSEYSTIQPGHASVQAIEVRRDDLTTLAAPAAMDSEQRTLTTKDQSKDGSLSSGDRSTKDVALEATPGLGQVRMKPRDDGGIPSRHPVVLSSEYSTIQPGHASVQAIEVRRDDLTTLAAPAAMDSEQRTLTTKDRSKDVNLSSVDRSIKDVAVEATPGLSQVRTKQKHDGGIASSRPLGPFSEQSTVRLDHASAQEITVQHRGKSTTPEASGSMDPDQRRATSRRNPSDDKAVSLSPIDRSIVGQEGTAASRKPTAQPASSPSRVPSDEAKRSATSRTSSLIEKFASEQSAVSSTGAESRPRDREPDNHVAARGTQIRASSSPRPLVGAPTVLGDGEPQPKRRLSAAVSESERTIPTSRSAAVGEMPDLSALSLDPSLVVPAPATKAGVTSRPITSRKGENPPVTPSSPADREEPFAPSLAGPMASKKLIAERRVAAPMKAATVSHAMATDRVKSAEPVVQVTIGRVEVRAVTPPVRQEKGRKPQSAMSLDEYLKRRGGRGGG